jgi:hypothetical protein
VKSRREQVSPRGGNSFGIARHWHLQIEIAVQRRDGPLDRIHDALYVRCEQALREPSPTVDCRRVWQVE